MAMKMIPTKKATVDQIRRFCIVSGIEGCEKATRDDLIEMLGLTGYPTQTIYVDDEQSKPLRHDAGQFRQRESDYDPENERWVICRIAPNAEAEDSDASVYIGVQNDDFNDSIYALVGEDICIRERFYLNLLACVEQRKVQKPEGKDGLPSKFREAARKQVSRYPTTFIGYAGLVKDGPPKDLPEGVYSYAHSA